MVINKVANPKLQWLFLQLHVYLRVDSDVKPGVVTMLGLHASFLINFIHENSYFRRHVVCIQNLKENVSVRTAGLWIARVRV